MPQESVKERQLKENFRIYERNIPAAPLQPYLDVRPASTKYSYLPIVDPRKLNSVSLVQQPDFNVHKTFNPGNTQSPWSGFASNINRESELRNQVFALQKCSQSTYVPQSNSDLYTYSFQPTQTAQTHQLLFQRDNFGAFNPNPDANVVGYGLFFNSTRSQMKDLTGEKGV
jgi:hypothetical protein